MFQVCGCCAASSTWVCHWPWPRGPGFLKPVHLDGARLNAIPSLHTAWALLNFWRTYKSRKALRLAATLFLRFTLLATLGLGEQYLIDLVVAVSFAVAVRAVFLPRPDWSCDRKFAVTANAAVIAAWLAALRTGMLVNSPAAVAWTLALGTAAYALWSNARLRSPARFAVFGTVVNRTGDPSMAASPAGMLKGN